MFDHEQSYFTFNKIVYLFPTWNFNNDRFTKKKLTNAPTIIGEYAVECEYIITISIFTKS